MIHATKWLVRSSLTRYCFKDRYDSSKQAGRDAQAGNQDTEEPRVPVSGSHSDGFRTLSEMPRFIARLPCLSSQWRQLWRPRSHSQKKGTYIVGYSVVSVLTPGLHRL